MNQRLAKLVWRRVLLLEEFSDMLEQGDRDDVQFARTLLERPDTPERRLLKAAAYLDGIYQKQWPGSVSIDDAVDWDWLEQQEGYDVRAAA